MRYLFLIIFCLWGSLGWAGSYSLGQLDADLVSNNPKLKALQLNYLGLQADIKSQASFNDLMAGMEWRGPQRSLFIAQQIPFLGKLNDLEKIAFFESQSAYFEFLSYQNELHQEILKLIYRQKILTAKEKVFNEELKTFDQTLSGLQTKLAGGKGSMKDVYALKLAKVNLQKQIIDLKQQQTEVAQELAEKLSVSPDTYFEVALPVLKNLKVNAEQLPKDLLEQNYELRQRQAMLEKRFWQKELSGKGYLPDFNVKVGSMETPGMPNDLMGEFSINIPWFNARHDGEVQWMQSLSAMSVSEKMVLQRNLVSKANILISQWQSILQKNNLVTTETLKFSKLRYESLKNLYQTDQADLSELTESRRDFLQAQLEALDLQEQGLMTYLDLMILVPQKEAL